MERILASLGEPAEAPPLSLSRAPPEEAFDFNQDDEFELDQTLEYADGTGERPIYTPLVTEMHGQEPAGEPARPEPAISGTA